MTSKPRRQNREATMKPVITGDKLHACMFLSRATTNLTMMLGHASSAEDMLDEAVDFMDAGGKAKLALVTSNFIKARVLLNTALLGLISMSNDLAADADGEVYPDAE